MSDANDFRPRSILRRGDEKLFDPNYGATTASKAAVSGRLTSDSSETSNNLEATIRRLQADKAELQQTVSSHAGYYVAEKAKEDRVTDVTYQLATLSAQNHNISNAFMEYLYTQYLADMAAPKPGSTQRKGKKGVWGSTAPETSSASVGGFRSFVRGQGQVCNTGILSDDALTEFIDSKLDQRREGSELSRPSSAASVREIRGPQANATSWASIAAIK